MTTSEPEFDESGAFEPYYECEHKWRAYEQIGVVCRDCGTKAPHEVARQIACHKEDAEGLS